MTAPRVTASPVTASPVTGRGSIDELVVVIPARNEEELLPRCLDALSTAIAEVHAVRDPAPPTVSVVIVLDRCTDQTARIAAGWPDFDRLHTDTGIVGTARRAGVLHLLPSPARYTGSTWIATTDADSAVPSNWLTAQLAFARNDVDLVLGTVQPDDCLPEAARDRWTAQHRLAEGHPHIHGANLGVRADRYRQAGGFACIDRHEDVRLVSALRELRVSEIRTALIPVLTSGRLDGRAPAGFAGYLRGQADDFAGGAESLV